MDPGPSQPLSTQRRRRRLFYKLLAKITLQVPATKGLVVFPDRVGRAKPDILKHMEKAPLGVCIQAQSLSFKFESLQHPPQHPSQYLKGTQLCITSRPPSETSRTKRGLNPRMSPFLARPSTVKRRSKSSSPVILALWKLHVGALRTPAAAEASPNVHLQLRGVGGKRRSHTSPPERFCLAQSVQGSISVSAVMKQQTLGPVTSFPVKAWMFSKRNISVGVAWILAYGAYLEVSFIAACSMKCWAQGPVLRRWIYVSLRLKQLIQTRETLVPIAERKRTALLENGGGRSIIQT